MEAVFHAPGVCRGNNFRLEKRFSRRNHLVIGWNYFHLKLTRVRRAWSLDARRSEPATICVL